MQDLSRDVFIGQGYCIISKAPQKFTASFTPEVVLTGGAWTDDEFTVVTPSVFVKNDVIKNTDTGEKMVVTAVVVDSPVGEDTITVKRGFTFNADPIANFVITAGDSFTKDGTWELYDKTKNFFVDTSQEGEIKVTKESEQATAGTAWRGDVKIVNTKSTYKMAAEFPTNFLAKELKEIMQDLEVIERDGKSIAHFKSDNGKVITPLTIFVLPIESTDTDRCSLLYGAAHNNNNEFTYSKNQAVLPLEFTTLNDKVFGNTMSYGGIPIPEIA